MGRNIYIFLLLLCGRTYCGFYDPKDIQDFNESADKDKELFSMRYYKLKAVNDEIVTKEAQNKELTAENQRIKDEQVVLNKEKEKAQNEMTELNKELETKVRLNEKIQNDIEVKQAKEVELKKIIHEAQNDIADLNKEKAEVVNTVCKEQYTLWNFEFLSNNKKSVFTSLLTTVLITALWPFVLKSLSLFLSDDEDSSGMVATSSGLLNSLKYNCDNLNLNLKLRWQNLNPEECVKLNLWKVENGELTFTKLMVKKVIKTEKPLLTFELFQTRVNDGSLHVDCKETELAGDDSRVEAKLAMRIFNSLPEFSV
eukprot:GFUD01035325.1.p1 GENE.GFUD01035325.1~~GFUD01035325.1.p1  ORF type:complete len:312 (+),score=74.74 GFUD01035325.1:297-1232(+)